MTEKKPEKKKKKEICIKAGVAANEVIHCFINTAEKAKKAGRSAVKLTDEYTKATAKGCRNIYTNVDKFRRRIETKFKLAYLQNKQKEIFIKIGRIIFNGKESKQGNILERNEMKELLKQAKLCRDNILKIKEDIANQIRNANTYNNKNVGKKTAKKTNASGRKPKAAPAAEV